MGGADRHPFSDRHRHLCIRLNDGKADDKAAYVVRSAFGPTSAYHLPSPDCVNCSILCRIICKVLMY